MTSPSILSSPLQGNIHGVGTPPLGNGLAAFQFQAPCNPDAQWLEYLVSAAQILKGASHFAPFPCVKVAAGITLELLRMIQGMKQNQDEFQDLARSLIMTIRAMSATLSANIDDDYSTSYFVDKCQHYLDFLTAHMVHINQIVRETQTWRWYMNYTSTRQQISRLKQNIDDFRTSFTETTLVDLYFHINRLPKELSTWSSKPIRLIDAMNLTLDIPRELCTTRDDFHDFLIFIFRKRRGRRYVERKRYDITDALVTNRPLTDDIWSFTVQPGVTLVMNIVLKRDIREATADSRQCPACRYLCRLAAVGDEMTCPCGTVFQVSHAFVEEILVSNSSQATQSAGAANVVVRNSIHSMSSDRPSRRASRISYSSKDYDPTALDLSDFRRFRICGLSAPSSTPVTAIKLNQILEPSNGALEMPYLRWNMLFGIDDCELAPESPVPWSTARDEPAAFGEASLIVVRFESLPPEWTLDVYEEQPGSGITCCQLITALSDFLYHPLEPTTCDALPESQKQQIWEAYWLNRFQATGGSGERLGNALTRLDFLMNDVIFGGLYHDDVHTTRSVDETMWPTFVVRCLPRRPSQSDSQDRETQSVLPLYDNPAQRDYATPERLGEPPSYSSDRPSTSSSSGTKVLKLPLGLKGSARYMDETEPPQTNAVQNPSSVSNDHPLPPTLPSNKKMGKAKNRQPKTTKHFTGSVHQVNEEQFGQIMMAHGFL